MNAKITDSAYFKIIVHGGFADWFVDFFLSVVIERRIANASGEEKRELEKKFAAVSAVNRRIVIAFLTIEDRKELDNELIHIFNGDKDRNYKYHKISYVYTAFDINTSGKKANAFGLELKKIFDCYKNKASRILSQPKSNYGRCSTTGNSSGEEAVTSHRREKERIAHEICDELYGISKKVILALDEISSHDKITIITKNMTDEQRIELFAILSELPYVETIQPDDNNKVLEESQLDSNQDNISAEL